MPNDQGTAVATRQNTEIGQFQAMLESRSREIQMSLPAHITPDKFQRTIMTAVAQNPDLLKADRQSLILACYKAAQDGLLPDGREAALVTFKQNKKTQTGWETKVLVQYMPMVYGLRKKILQSGEVVALEVGVVYAKEVESGHFYYEVGKFPPLGHRPMLSLTIDDTQDEQIVGAYSIATMKDGTKSYEFMRRFEIDKVRECSQTGATRDRQGKPRNPSGPWVDWFPEQAKKTVMRRHSKTLPQSGDVIIDVEGRELEHGASAALALGVEPDAPLITDESGDTIDMSTGQVVGNGSEDATEGTASTTQQLKPEEASGSTATAGQTATTPAEDSDSDQTDELGVTKDPAEAKTDEVIAGFDKAELLPDLKKLYKAIEPHLEFMPAQLQEAIENAYDRNVARLAPAKAKAEAEPAK